MKPSFRLLVVLMLVALAVPWAWAAAGRAKLRREVEADARRRGYPTGDVGRPEIWPYPLYHRVLDASRTPEEAEGRVHDADSVAYFMALPEYAVDTVLAQVFHFPVGHLQMHYRGGRSYLAVDAPLPPREARRPREAALAWHNARRGAQRAWVAAHADSLERMVARLATLPGEFVRRDHRTWVFSDGGGPLHGPAAFGHAAVARLVACLDDARPAAATVDGRPVLVGAMCGHALRWMAYPRELEAESGWADRPERSPFEVEPTASPDELRAAKAAWSRAVRNGTYSLLLEDGF